MFYTLNMLKNKSYTLLIICFFVILLPFIIDLRVSDFALSIRYFAYSIMIFVIFLIRKKEAYAIQVIKSPVVVSLLLLFLISFVSSLLNGFDGDTFFSLFRLLIFIFSIVLFSTIFLKENYLFIAKSILLFSAINLFFFSFQFFYAYKNSNDIIKSLEVISATMANKSLLASVLFLTLPFIFYVFYFASNYWKIFVAFIFSLILICLVFIHSKVTLLALLTSLIVISFFILKKHKIIFFSTLTFVFSLLFSVLFFNSTLSQQFYNEINQLKMKKERFENNRLVENDARIALYSKTMKMIKHNFFYGVGPGNWKVEFPKYGLTNTVGKSGRKIAQRPHSDFLWYFSESGIFAAIFYLLFFFFVLYEVLLLFIKTKTKRKYFFLIIFSIIFGYFVISLFDYPSERLSHNFLFSILISIIISEKLRLKPYYFIYNKIIFFISTIFLCLFLCFSYCKYHNDKQMTYVSNFKESEKWDKMLLHLDKLYFTSLFSLDNTSTPIKWYYGIYYYYQNDMNKAYDYFKEAYKINQFHLHVLNNLATCYAFKNNYFLAKKIYKKALNISSGFEEAALNLAIIHSAENKNEIALDILLDVHNFNLIKSDILSKMYISYFKEILLKLIKKELVDINYDNLAKNNIFVSSDKKDSFKQIKDISWMRKEKNMTFKQIIKKLDI